MKIFWKYVFPPAFGLLIYVVIRVINDTATGFRFWERSWALNIFEILYCSATGYLMLFVYQKLFNRFDKDLQNSFSYKIILNELLWVIVVTEVCMNLFITPMAALTDDGLSWGDFAIINIIPLLFNLIYYAVVRSNKLLKAYVDKKMQLEKLTNDHLETELKFLKAQYHPHFLFNALNTIYFQMDENIDEAKKTVEKFSELLRYQLYDQQQMVPIHQELLYLNNFIHLQRTRSSDKLQLNVLIEQFNGEKIYPLLFLPLVENAFKYIGGEYLLQIEALKEKDEIVFRVKNSIPGGLHRHPNGGIGLDNLKRRLDLLYPGKHHFIAGEKDREFFAELKLQHS